jgi:hypothetical protein
MLTIPSTYTRPSPVVAGDGFDLFVVVRNVSAVELESIVVTYVVEASSGLTLADTTNVVSIPWLRPDSQATVSIHLRYMSFTRGVQLVPIIVNYAYWEGSVRLSGTTRTTALVEVVGPTSTPTSTSTATPTSTPSPTPTPTDTATPTPSPTDTATPTPTPDAGDLLDRPQGDFGPPFGDEPGVGHALVLLESYEPVWVDLGGRSSFMLTLGLSNMGSGTASLVTVRLDSPDFIRTGGDNQGRGQVWFFSDSLEPGQRILSSSSYTFIGSGGDGLYTIPVSIEYRDTLGAERTQADQITLILDVWPARFPSPTLAVTQTPPATMSRPATSPTSAGILPLQTPEAPLSEAWWLSLLRAILGEQTPP